MLLKHTGENRIIKGLSKKFRQASKRIVAGIGDDAAVTCQRKDRLLIITTDSLIEGVHFSLSHSPAYLIGRKSVSISLSDIAAMGGEPLFLLTSIAMPAAAELEFLNEIYRGIASVCKGHGVSLIGGNTSASRRDMNITTTILGETPPEELVLRKGARPGELIFVTGSLGDSGLGLKALKSGYPKKTYAHAIKKHLDPEARVLAGRLLAKKRIPTAMTDISDGLIADLKHIMDQGRVGAEVFIEKLPLSDSLKKHLPNGLKLALTGGEDYELLFTAAEEKTLEIKRLSDKLGLPITAIGQITGRTQVLGLIDNKGRSIKLRQDGFEHFALPRR